MQINSKVWRTIFSSKCLRGKPPVSPTSDSLPSQPEPSKRVSTLKLSPSEQVVSDKTSWLDSGPTANPAVISSWETRSQKHKQMYPSFVPRKLLAVSCSIIYWSSFSTKSNRLNPF
ncbi:unnamed protein product [Oikopleura dioica]|uniref:Uncharacterized protein n=1 Tax=Oikopleura dioica TaxID=34765 RepID=E4YSQ5_OIKDI|nr:unnamed protein product [Oikopleura dioica]